MITRRQFSTMALTGMVVPVITGRWADAGPIGGVRIGVQTYSFRELTKAGAGNGVDVVINSMKACGLDECELWSPQIEGAPGATAAGRGDSPTAQQAAREALRRWRESTPMTFYEDVRRRFTAAGITIYAYNLSFNDSFSESEIDQGFAAAKALAAEVITASTTLSMARRLVPFVEKHRVPVAMHNHSRVDDPNEFATPQSFTTALAMSPLFKVNLDIGHFTAADFDALAFLEKHHDRITNLHIKDRKKNQGDNMPWGQGDTPIRETLLWLKRRSSPVRAYIEYEYAGTKGAVTEVTTCLEFVKKVITS